MVIYDHVSLKIVLCINNRINSALFKSDLSITYAHITPHKFHTINLWMPIIGNQGRKCERKCEKIECALLREVVTELDPACPVKNGSIEARFAPTEQPNPVSVSRVLTWAEPLLMLGALALTIDPRLGLRLSTGAPMVYLVSLYSNSVRHILRYLRDGLIRKPIFFPWPGCNSGLSEEACS